MSLTASADPGAHEAVPRPAEIDWNALLAPFCKPVTRASVFQLASTVLLLVTFWVAMYWSLAYSYGLTLLLSVPAAAMTMRLFMLQHDCGHGSFFRSQRANNIVGGLIGVFTLVPYIVLAPDARHSPCRVRQPRRARPGRHRHADGS